MQLLDAKRRRKPRIFDTDWLVLRYLAAAIEREAQILASDKLVAIDFGCGNQPYRSLFEQRGVRYLGADLGDESELTISEEGRIETEDASADLVVSFQVLEHVRNLDLYLAEARRVIQPDGAMLLSTHGTWLYHPHPEDHRRWTRAGLIYELESRGWRIESCAALVGPLAWTTLVRLTGYNFALRKIPLLGGIMGQLLATIMNARAVAEDTITPASIRDDNACVYLVRARPARSVS